jgi:hydrogenase-4 component B
MNEWLVLAAAAMAGAAGLPGLFLPRGANAGQRLSTVLQVAASGLGIWVALRVLLVGPGQGISLPLTIPGAELSLAVDGLSAAFLLPVFLISALGAVFGEEYWKQSANPRNGRKLRFFYGLLTCGLALLVVARDAFCFLVGWEIMALSCFFAMTAEDDKGEVREAGWIYFASTHVSTLVLFAFFALHYIASGSLALEPFSPGGVSEGTANALFLLALAAFGLKAGLFPLHFWLPPAHATAPSHVSALMSGVLIKMGVYGLLRVTSLFPQVPLWWGACFLALGGISGVLGVAQAIGQHDLKRLLAYHSIENIGIIFMGLGLAVAGRALGRSEWVVLGLAAAVLHTWNHGLFKALLFLAAGSAIHAAHTREIDRLGGLSKPMPFTAAFFLVGAVAICGLPPLNGFVSELFLYLGLFRAGCDSGGVEWGLALLAIPVLALIGSLALACFVKVHGAVFLGTPRTAAAEHAREAGLAMTVPMGVLAALCATIGLAPAAVAPLLDSVARCWAPGAPLLPLAAAAPLGWLSVTGAVVVALLAAGSVAFLRRSSIPPRALPTWDCGYTAPSSSMQYTASSFAEMVVGLFKWVLLPRTHAARPRGLFPGPAAFHSQVPDAVLDRLILPVSVFLARACSWLRLLQRGKINAYLFYIFITLLVLLLWK